MKTRNSRKIGTVLCLCAVMLAGCSKESDFGGLAETTSGIGFEVNLAGDQEETAQTRSTLGTKAFEGGNFDSGNLYLHTTVTENEENPFAAAMSRATTLTASTLSSFGVYAYAYSSSTNWSSSPSANLYIEGETVTQSGSLWAFNPTQYWPSTAYKLAFFAYAPTTLGSSDGSLEVSLNSSNLPQIAYTVPTSYANQKDLIVATATDQTGSGSSVSLEFSHILTAVQVKCGSVPEGTISSITFSGIQNQGTYDLAEGSWTLGSGTTTYEIEGDFTAANSAEILTGDYTLMLLPQSLGSSATVTVTYTPTGGDKTTLTASLSGQEWKAGTTVTYLLSWEEATNRDLNGHEAVDLGLSVLWATCNVGASSETDYGNYYAWGEISTKSSYSSSNSTWYGNSSVTEDEIKGNPLYDAATANWGGTWRLPTSTEITELVNNTTHTWGTKNGVYGCTVTGTKGNSIFLPAAGHYKESDLVLGGQGSYWSCSPYSMDKITVYAYEIFFQMEGNNFKFTKSGSSYYFELYYGLSVRPVSE